MEDDGGNRGISNAKSVNPGRGAFPELQLDD